MHSYFREHDLPVQICFVTASKEDAPVVQLCRELDLSCHVLSIKDMSIFEERLLALCKESRIDLIALAGFMKMLSAEFLTTVGVPVFNIHPALLPKYGGKGMYGMNVHEAVFAAKERVSGASIHRVDPIYDHGEIIAQSEVEITDCSSPEEVAAKVLKIEHQLYAPAIYSYLQDSCK